MILDVIGSNIQTVNAAHSGKQGKKGRGSKCPMEPSHQDKRPTFIPYLVYHVKKEPWDLQVVERGTAFPFVSCISEDA